MAAIVSLRDVVEEISVQPEGVMAHLNPDTGEIVKETIRRLDIEEEWYRFHDAAIETIARESLEAHGIAYR